MANAFTLTVSTCRASESLGTPGPALGQRRLRTRKGQWLLINMCGIPVGLLDV